MHQSLGIDYIQPQQLYNATLNAYSHVTRIFMANISEIVHIAGQGGEDVSGRLFNNFKQQYCASPNFPACTLIPIPCLALDHMNIEIDAIAYHFASLQNEM